MAYARDRSLQPYLAFCAERGANAIPADEPVFSAFLLSRAGDELAAMGNARRAVERAHRGAGLPPPSVRPDIRALERLHFVAPTVVTIGAREVAAILAVLDPSVPTDARDGAATVLAHVHGWHVDEIRSLRVEDVRFSEGGVVLKNEKLADAAPDTALSPWLRAWMLHLGRDDGALFVAWNRKGYWTTTPLDHFGMYGNVRRAALRAGVAARGADGRHGAQLASMSATLRRRAR